MLSLPVAHFEATEAAFQLGPLALLALVYARRSRTLVGTGHPVPRWRQVCGWLTTSTVSAQNLSYLRSHSKRPYLTHLANLTRRSRSYGSPVFSYVKGALHAQSE